MAQPPEQRSGITVERTGERLRQIGLEDLPGANVLDDLSDAALVVSPRSMRLDPGRIRDLDVRQRRRQGVKLPNARRIEGRQ